MSNKFFQEDNVKKQERTIFKESKAEKFWELGIYWNLGNTVNLNREKYKETHTQSCGREIAKNQRPKK